MMKKELLSTALNRPFLLRALLPVLCLLMLLTAATAAPIRDISGKVTDEKGEALPGVTVLIKGTTIGTATNANGEYTLSAPQETGTLVFSFVGYLTKEVSMGNAAVLNVTLATDAKALEEVVVVGYGTQKKSDVTGSVSQVKASDITTVATASVATALQGRASGVSVSTDNSPGGQPTIRIRGSGSITAGNNPLIVLDGLPLENTNLNDINPSDIESMEILKDASSTAIYGSRGANGVIMITTKKGKAGQNNVSFSSYYGIETPSRLIDMVEGEDFVNFINAAYTNQIKRPVYSAANPAPDNNTNWQKELIRSSGPIQNYNLNFSGGNEKTKYLLSAGVFSQDGLLLESGFKRYTVRTNLEHAINNRITVGTHLQLNRSNREVFDPGIMNVFRYGWPTMPVRDPDGSWYYAIDDAFHRPYVEGRWNPVADAGQISDRTGVNRVVGDIYAVLDLGKHFTFRTNIGGDISDSKNNYYATSLSTTGWNNKGTGRQTVSQEQQIINENILTYDNNWGDHHLTATGVYSYQDHAFETLTVSGSGFPSDITEFNDVSLATIRQTPVSNKYSNKLISLTSRAFYSYKSKYLLTVTGRYDGSSRFGANNKWGFFPSLGLGWNLSDENFMQSLSSVVSNLKLRSSVGYTGNQEIGNYRSLALLVSPPSYYIYNSTNLLLALREGLGNPDLKWEKTRQIDAGMDASLLNNRIDVTFDFYRRNTTDLLYQVPIPTSSGFSNMLQNIGEVQNQGVEFSLNGHIIDNDNFKWNLGGNLTKNNNKVVSLYNNVESVILGDDQGVARYLKVGLPLNGVWTRKSAGIIKTQEEANALKKIQPTAEPGGEKYEDINGDGQINSSDYVYIGSTEPNFYYGLNTNLSFKRFTLDIYGQGATNLATTSTGYEIIGNYQIQNRNYLPSQYSYDRMWSESNPNGTQPKAGAKDVQFSDQSNGNRDHFLIRNIRLGYSFNPQWFSKFSLKSMNAYVNAQNYFTFSNFQGYNPETGSVAYPYAKSLIFGLDVNF